MRKLIIGFISFLVITIVVVSFFRYREDLKYKKIGEKLIEKIELYQSLHKKLPSDLKDLKETESMGYGPYYQKIDESQYEITFCFGFDEYLIYNSQKKCWYKK